jgi:transcription elongation factor Elf1
VSDREDYPDCVFCGERIRWATVSNDIGTLLFHCHSCGQGVEVDITDEGLLRDSRGR